MRENLKKAIDFAQETGSFSKANQAKAATFVCVFGLGRYFEEAFDYWNFKEKLGVNILCDNNSEKWGKEYKGLRCISPEELYQLENVVVIPMIGNLELIEEQLIAHKLKYFIPSDAIFEMIAEMPRDVEWFGNNRIMEVYDMLEDDKSKELYANIVCNRIAQQFSKRRYVEMMSQNEYFNPEFFQFDEEEFFVDCGAYNGDSLKAFLEYTNSKFSGAVSFEMDNGNFEQLTTYVKNLPSELQDKITCIHAGVWNENSELEYGKEANGNGESFSLLKGDNCIKVKTVKIDDAIMQDTVVTMIKMDIEGAELNALRGAENIIKTQKPKLAICIYHKLSDFWEIPTYLKQLVPEYKFSVRHHFSGIEGTILYAYF